MILHKALVILTVIFDIITCMNEMEIIKEATKSIAVYKNSTEYKHYKDSTECKECVDILSKVGLQSDSGLYNFMFFHQFETNEKLLDYVRSKMETQNDPTSAINNDQSKSMKGDIASYLNSIYAFIFGNNDVLKNIAKTPKDFCTSLLNGDLKQEFEDMEQEVESEIATESSAINEQPTEQSISIEEQPMSIEEQPTAIDEQSISIEEQPMSIEACERLILDYKLKKKDKMFKYDNNGYICFLTSYDISVTAKEDEDEDIAKEMPNAVNKYFMYHVSKTLKLNEQFTLFTAPELCINYLIKKNKNTSNIA